MTLPEKVIEDRCAHRLEANMAERDRYYLAQIQALKEAVCSAMADADKALSKAETASEKRFDSVNEFRAALTDNNTNFVRHDYYNERHSSLEVRVDNVNEKVNELLRRWEATKGRGGAFSDIGGWIIALITSGIAIMAVAVHWIRG